MAQIESNRVFHVTRAALPDEPSSERTLTGKLDWFLENLQ